MQRLRLDPWRQCLPPASAEPAAPRHHSTFHEAWAELDIYKWGSQATVQHLCVCRTPLPSSEALLAALDGSKIMFRERNKKHIYSHFPLSPRPTLFMANNQHVEAIT